MIQKDFIDKVKEKFPDEEFKIIYAGKNSKENSVFKCLICGRRIEINTGELFRTRRKHICSKCYYKRQDTQKNEEILLERLKGKATNIEFYMKERKGIKHNMINFTCSKCGRINTKEVANFLKQKYDCGYCEGKKESKDNDFFQKELKEKYGEKFILLTEYENANTSIKVKCNNCGFIREVKPNNLLRSGYCPKCEKKDSLGEKQIIKFLEMNNIKYIPQMYFSNLDIDLHYFDFYIPEYNLVLEYHGSQHYQFNPFFHKNEEVFYYRQKKDMLKKNAAINNKLNYISIKYTLFNELNIILKYIFNSTTIPSGSRGKCLEIETIQDIG